MKCLPASMHIYTYIYTHIYIYVYVCMYVFFIYSFVLPCAFFLDHFSVRFIWWCITGERPEERTVEDGFGIGQFTGLGGSDGFQQALSVEDMRNAEEME